MAAVANLSSFTLGSLLQQQPSGSSGGGKASTQINPSTQFPLLSPVFTCCRASLNYRRNSFVQGGHKVLFMIQKLSSACNCHGRLQHFVCNSVDESSESAASQVNSDAQRAEEQPYGIPEKRVPEHWGVVGLGQAMVDFSGIIGDDFLKELGLVKGTRKVVNHEERGKVLRALDGRNYKLSAGGSLSNTLVALARLGVASSHNSAQNVAMTGSVGSDALGDFYRTKLLRANVHFLSQPVVGGTTGTVIVLTTPDAQRTMLSYQGMSSIVNFDSVLADAIAKSRVLVVEGYLWEINQTIEAIAQACETARQQGVLVALTASDVSCVTRHRQQFWDVMCQSSDILFANADEARALCALGNDCTPEQATKHLNQFCSLVSVTDGARGSYIGLRGEVFFIPPAPCVPVDTCGAGDAYAAVFQMLWIIE
uniref:Carbohydrate kinase PfkB domain-containing protein n=2 Tax=Physcomitrium patens TaxID=3218 RepID=A0A7I4AR62_PHYPA